MYRKEIINKILLCNKNPQPGCSNTKVYFEVSAMLLFGETLRKITFPFIYKYKKIILVKIFLTQFEFIYFC